MTLAEELAQANNFDPAEFYRVPKVVVDRTICAKCKAAPRMDKFCYCRACHSDRMRDYRIRKASGAIRGYAKP